MSKKDRWGNPIKPIAQQVRPGVYVPAALYQQSSGGRQVSGINQGFNVIESHQYQGRAGQNSSPKKGVGHQNNGQNYQLISGAIDQNQQQHVYAVYKLNKEASYLQVMLHHLQLRDDCIEYVNCDKIPVQVGKEHFIVHHAYFNTKPYQRNDYQIKLLDPGAISKYNDTDYFETYGTFRPHDPSRHSFAFHLNFVRNNKHIYFKEPPGENMLDPLEQLLIFSAYCIQEEQYDALEALINQFPVRYDNIQAQVNQRDTWKKFAQRFDFIIGQNQDKLDQIIQHILSVHSLLPLKINHLNGFVMNQNPSVINAGEMYFVREQLVDQNDTEESVVNGNLNTIKGYLLHLIFNKIQQKLDWIKVLDSIGQHQPLLFRPIVKHLLFYFVSNDQRLTKEQFQFIQKLIDDGLYSQQFNLDAVIELKTILLDFTVQFEDFFLYLSEVCRLIKDFENPDQQYINPANIAYEKNIMIYQLKAALENYMTERVQTIEYAVNFMLQLKDSSDEIKHMIQMSSFPHKLEACIIQHCNQPNIKFISLELLREVFINLFSLNLLHNKTSLFKQVVDILLSARVNKGFRPVYQMLLMDMNKGDINFNKVTEWINSKADMQIGIKELIKQYDSFIEDLQKICATSEKNHSEFLNYVATTCVEYIQSKLFNNRQDLTDVLIFLDDCTNQLLQNKCAEKLNWYIQNANNQFQSNYNPRNLLPKLIAHRQQREYQRKLSRIAELVLNESFALFNERPQFSEVKRTLITNASIDHTWYRVLSSYQYYGQQDFTKHLEQQLRTLTIKLVNREFNLEDIVAIKNQTPQVRQDFISYLTKAVEVNKLKNLIGQDFAALLDTLIAEVNDKITQFYQLRDFLIIFLKLGEEHALLQTLNRDYHDYLKKNIGQVVLSNQLKPYLEQAQKLHFLKDSVVFSKQLDEEYEHEGQGDLEGMLDACERSYNNLLNKILAFLSGTYTASQIKNYLMANENFLQVQQIRKEIEIFKKLVNVPNQADNLKFQFLENVMIAISEQQTLEQHCNNIISIATMSNQSNQEQQRMLVGGSILPARKIYKVNFEAQIRDANLFLENCVINFGTVGADDYLEAYKYAQARLIKSIEVRDGERLKILSIFSKLSQSIELFQFVRLVKTEDLEQLKDYVNEYDESMVDTQTINFCVAISDYLNAMDKQFPYGLSYHEFITYIKEGMMNEQYRDLADMIGKCYNQIASIKDLRTTLESKEEAKKKQILEIMKSCSYSFELKDDQWKVELTYQKNNRQQTFNLDQLLELRDRALLIQHTSSYVSKSEQPMALEQEKEKKQEEEHKTINKYAQFSNSIRLIIQNLNLLLQYGYPDLETKFRSHMISRKSEFDDLKALELSVEDKLREWQNDLVQGYSQNYWLTFIDGWNFWIVEGYLLKKPQHIQQQQKAQNILKFMGKNFDPRFFNFRANLNLEPKQRLLCLGSMLDQVENRVRLNNVQLMPAESLAKIQITTGEILYMDQFKPIVGILSIFINSERPFPRADQLLFCNELTSWQEIQSFLYRCVKSERQDLHLMIKPELLSLDNQDKLTSLISQLVQREMLDFPFFFGIITADPRSYVSNTIKYQNYTKILKDSNILQEQKITQTIKRIDNKTTLVLSTHSGFGKTSYIKRVAQQDGKILHLFPIAGDISYELIGSRLSELEFPEGNPSILCLQINFVNNQALLNEMIINLALFKILKSPSDIFILPENCEIWIELANTFDNSLISGIFYCQYIKTHLIEQFSLRDLELSNLDPLADPIVQVCCNLQMFKDQTIITNDPTDELLRNISQNRGQCIQLLEEYFVTQQRELHQEPNYIQMRIFIKILSTLFKNFKKSTFSPDEVNFQIEEFKANGLAQIVPAYERIRYSVVEAMLMTVKEFTIKSINRQMTQIQSSALQMIKKNSEAEEDAEMRDEENGVQGNNNEEEKNQQADIALRQADIAENLEMQLSWDSSNHFNIVLIEDGSVMFIYKDQEQVPDNIKRLIFIQANARENNGDQLMQKINSGRFQIEDIARMDAGQLSNKLQLLRTGNHHNFEERKDYVVTTDNYLKMCVIYLRIQSQVPVIIMGETGCGKTTLLDYLCKNIRKESLEIFNIHAGVTYQKIINQMRTYIALANNIPEQKLWVFFDEFNTTENIGLICEILCERQLQGERIPDNICLIAACNPYKLRSKSISIEENVGIKRSNQSKGFSKLLYTVHPLPDSVIEYVWDFGALSDSDYEKYIDQMLKVSRATIDNDIYQLELSRDHQLKVINLMQRMLVSCHKYFKKEEEASSVSLRDVARFNKLFKWFKKSLIAKRQILQQIRNHTESYMRNKTKYEVKTQIEINDGQLELRANILALCHCYYLRISKLEQRERFLETICQVVTNRDPYEITPQIIKKIVSEEQNDYLCRMELSQGTAVNQALKENIFALIPCIMCRIPIFICGKPGCSKSLAIQLIFANLRGHKSVDRYFQTLKEITMFSFQGSDSCTSDGILKAYSRAEEYLKKNQTALPVFVFDEIGLAEISKHNPLKVLHSLLDNNDSKIAFVGISNWRLDASKMNRALYLARPDPDEQDLIFTALSIFKSICPFTRNKDELIKNLARTYFELKAYYKRNEPQFTDFYGLRDFYHLIKQVSNFITTGNFNTDDDVLEFVKTAIQRNFGGKMHAVEKFGDMFMRKQKVEDKYPHIPNKTALELIEMNFRDRESRFLMVICKPDIAAYLIEREFQKLGKDKRTIVGSNLENDVNKEEYGFRSLSDVILYVEKGISIILKDMDHIYSSLYDLFNQNYSKFGDKNYCRIALGALLNPKCFVHDDFRCVIFMKEDDQSLRCADPPFLNRFEKHYIKMEQLLNEKQKTVVNLIQEWVQKMLTLNFKSNRNLQNCLKPTSLFPTYSNDQIGLLVLKKDDGVISVPNLFKECIEEMISYSTEDVLISCQISAMDNEERELIKGMYQQMHSVTFKEFVMNSINGELPIAHQANEDEEMKQPGLDEDEPMEGEYFQLNTMQRQPPQQRPQQPFQQPMLQNKIVAFTYTIGQVDLPKMAQVNVRSVSNFKSEEEVIKHLQDFYNSQQEKVLIIEADYQKDKYHISFMKYIIEKIEGEALHNQSLEDTITPRGDKRNSALGKTVILLIHLLRNDHEGEASMLPQFEGWTLKMFQDITSEKKPFLLVNNLGILSKNIVEIIEEEKLIDFEKVINNLTEKCLMSLVFEGDNGAEADNEQRGKEINENLAFIISNICKDPQLVQAIKVKIFEAITFERNQSDWTLAVCCNNEIFSQSPNIADAIKRVIETRVEKHLTSIFYLLEKNSAFRTYFTDDQEDHSQAIKDIWISIFKSPSLNIKQIQMQNISQSNYTSFIANLRFPFSRLEYEILKQLQKQQQEYEWTSDQGIGRTVLDNFKDIFIERSKVADMIQHIQTHLPIQKIYIEDMIRIFLIDNMLSTEYAKTIQLILNRIITRENDFFQKVYTFLMKQELFIVLCNILEIYHQIRGEQTTTEYTREMIGQIIDDYYANLDEQQNQDIMIDWKDISASIITHLAGDIYPNEANLIQVQQGINRRNDVIMPDNQVTIVGETLGSYSVLVEKIIGMVFKIEVDDRVDRIKVLRFWIDFANILSQHSQPTADEGKAREAIGLLVISAQLAQNIEQIAPPRQLNLDQLRDPGDDEEMKEPEEHEPQRQEFLDNNEFVSRIIIYFQGKTDERSNRFISSFLSLLLTYNAKHIESISNTFTALGDKFFKYTSKLFTQQIDLAGIQEAILNYQIQINQAEGHDYEDLLLQQDNAYFIEFEKILTSQGLTCKYAIALSDTIIKIGLGEDETLLNMYLPFRNYLRIACRDDIHRDEFPNTQKLIALSMIKVFLNIYAQSLFILHNPNPLPGQEAPQPTPEEEQALHLVDESIFHSPMKRTLQVYIIKKLKQKLGYNKNQIKQFVEERLKNRQYQWVDELDFGAGNAEGEGAQGVEMLPLIESIKDEEMQIQAYIKNICNSNEPNSKVQVKRFLQTCNTPKKKLTAGLAFLKAVYVRYAIQGVVVNQNLKTFYEQDLQQDILDIVLGVEYSGLIGLLIQNFPDNSFLKMEPSNDQAKIQQQIISCYALIFLLSYKGEQNALSGQYFRNGVFSIQTFKDSFLMGLEMEHKHQYIQNVMLNYDSLKFDTWRGYGGRYAKGSCYKCGNPQDGRECEYVYFVSACGGQMEEQNCPWCRAVIGGRNHKIHERPGHINLTDEEAKEYIRQVHDRYTNQSRPSYSPVTVPEQNSSLSFFNLHPVTWRFLRLFLHLPLYLMNTTNLANEEQLKDAFSEFGKQPHPLADIGRTPFLFLDHHIKNDLKMLFTQLSAFGNDVAAPWIYHIFSRFFDFMEANNGADPTTANVRDSFQRTVNEDLIAPNIAIVPQLSQAYKKKLIDNANLFDQLLEETIAVAENAPYLEYFRMTSEISFEGMKAAFFNQPMNSQQYKIMKISFDYFEDIKKLRKFHTIIDYTSSLLPMFNHQLTRQEARTKTIKDAFQYIGINWVAEAQPQFETFVKAWNNVGFENIIQYDCHRLTYQRYDAESPIISILLDNREAGIATGMCMGAGWQELSKLQNKILKELQDAYIQEMKIQGDLVFDATEYPVQKLKQEHILNVKLDSDDLLKSCAMNNITYGEGQEIIYDFARFQQNLIIDIVTRKLVRYDRMEFIQYQMELLTLNGEKSALINDIRKKYKQSLISQHTKELIDQQLDEFARGVGGNGPQMLKELHGGVEKIMFFLQNAKVDSEDRIETFCQNLPGRIIPQLKERTTISDVQIKNIVHLYEIIELKYFPKIAPTIREEFKNHDKRAEIRNYFNTLFEQQIDLGLGNLPSRQQIQLALMRFMIRCLAAQLEPTHQLALYLFRPDFWEEPNEQNDIENKIEALQYYGEGGFKPDLLLNSVECTYQVIDELNREKDRRGLAPQLVEQRFIPQQNNRQRGLNANSRASFKPPIRPGPRVQ